MLTRVPDLQDAFAADRLLVVGLGLGRISADIGASDTAASVQHLTLPDLDAQALRHAAPSLVICALLATDTTAGDAFDMVEALESLGYAGKIMVFCPPSLPRPAMIEAELQALGPGPRLTLVPH